MQECSLCLFRKSSVRAWQTDRWAKACCHIFRVCGHTFCIWQSGRVEGQKRQLLYNIGAVALKKTCGPLMDKGPCVVQRNERNVHVHFPCSLKNFDRRWWIFMCLPAKHTLNILNTLGNLKYFTGWSTKGPKGYISIIVHLFLLFYPVEYRSLSCCIVS